MPLYDLDMFYWLGYAHFVVGYLILIIWGQRLICHNECLARMLYLVEGRKFLFVTKTFHVPNMNLKMKCKLLGKCAPMSYVLKLFCFGSKPLHDANQWEVSYIEVGTWLGGFDMT
jgi:hypothetical protein